MTQARPTDRVPGAVVEQARAAIGSLNRSEARAAQTLLGFGSGVIRMSVSEVAEAAGTGIGTVVRACQSLGFKGFQDAKIALSADLAPMVGDRSPEHINLGDDPAQVLTKLATTGGEALARAPISVDSEALADAVKLLQTASRVLMIGVGTSSPLTQDMAYRLLTIGIAAEAPSDVHVQHVRARLLQPGDVAVAVSHTGATRETVDCARAAKTAGANVVAITSFTTTPLTEAADVALVAGGLETRYRVEAMASRLAHLLVIDSLLISLILTDSQRSDNAQALVADVLADHRF